MKLITIGGKEYKFEFSIEASLYNECTEKVAGLFINLEEAENTRQVVTSISDVPHTALIMFYAGLLEYHSDEIKSIDDAKALIKVYFKEDKEQNFYSVLNQMVDCMSDDGFFKQIGLTQMIEAMAEEEQEVPKEPKKPQDHKKKTTAKPKVTEK